MPNGGYFSSDWGSSSYPGPLPPAPTAPATPSTAIPAIAPAFGLNLVPMIVIVAGDVNIAAPGASIQRR